MTTQDWSKLTKDLGVLAEILEKSVDGFISLDKDQKIILFNRGAEQIFGYAAAEVLGKGLEMLLPEEARAGHREHVNAFASEKKASRMMGERKVLFGLTRDGRQIPLDIAIQHHDRSREVRYTAVCRDISQRVSREKNLSEEKAKFEALFNSSNRLIFLMDEQGVVRDMNVTARGFLVGEKECCIGRRIWDCAFWENKVDQARLKREVSDLGNEGFGRLQAQITSGEGKKVSLDIVLRKFSIEDSEERLIVLEAMDVTRLAETNEALRKSERSLARAQQIARLGNWDWNIETNDLHWSDEVYRIFGIKPTGLGASYPAFLETIHVDDRAKVEKAVANALNLGKPYNIIHRIVTSDGEEKVVHELGEVLRDSSGQPLYMAGTVQDITESWHREKALSEAHSKAEAANRAKSQFLATMSHELRTPLNAIIGFSSSMQDGIFGKIDDKYKEYAGFIQESGQHLLSIINDILDLSRIEVGTIEIRADWVRPERLVEKCLKFISERAHNKCIQLKTKVEENLGDLFLDERHCDQILINLLTNAVKFTEPGGTVEIGARSRGRDVEFYVRDTGIGMSEEDIGTVFQPFVQADMSYARNHEGVGLGLAIVKQLTELQGGKVELESTPGEGTCISIFFPTECAESGREESADIYDAAN